MMLQSEQQALIKVCITCQIKISEATSVLDDDLNDFLMEVLFVFVVFTKNIN